MAPTVSSDSGGGGGSSGAGSGAGSGGDAASRRRVAVPLHAPSRFDPLAVALGAPHLKQ